MAYEKALSLISGGGGITAYKIADDMETYELYVNVTYSELLEKVKNGLVLFINDASETSAQAYIVGGVDDSAAHTLYPQSADKLYHVWTYTNGKYVLKSGD